MRLLGRHQSFQPSETALSEVEIRERYGRVLADAYTEFRSDPSYLIDMAQTGAAIAYRRDLDQAQADAREMGVSVEQLVVERGIKPPPSKPMRVRRTT